VAKIVNLSAGVTRPPLDRFGSAAVGFLLLLVLAGSVQRLIVRRSGVIRTVPVRLAPPLPEGVHLVVSQIKPDPQDMYKYNVVSMVESFMSGHSLSHSRSISGPGGSVLVGLTSAGRTEIQTCLMDTGLAAVDMEQMLHQDRLLSSSNRVEKIKVTLIGGLTGRPRTRRPCWLVQLKADRMLQDGSRSQSELESRLLALTWPTLRSLRSTLLVNP
jgi:hypothetical protein